MKFLAIAVCATQVAAKPTFIPLIPGSTNVKGVASIGHINPKGGGDPNPFGMDFYKAETTWSVELCYKDSDSDGQFNGAELGDPCCEWVKGTNEKLAYTTATAPGDKASMQDPTIWASVKCADGSTPVEKATAYAAKAAGGTTVLAAPAAGSGSSADSETMTTPAPSAAGNETTPASTTQAPAAATPAPTTSGAVQATAAAAVAVTLGAAAFFA